MYKLECGDGFQFQHMRCTGKDKGEIMSVQFRPGFAPNLLI